MATQSALLDLIRRLRRISFYTIGWIITSPVYTSTSRRPAALFLVFLFFLYSLLFFRDLLLRLPNHMFDAAPTSLRRSLRIPLPWEDCLSGRLCSGGGVCILTNHSAALSSSWAHRSNTKYPRRPYGKRQCHTTDNRRLEKLHLLRPRRHHLPTELQTDVLHQVTRHLDLTNISRVPHWSNIVELQNARCVEEVNKRLRWVVQCSRLVCHCVPDNGFREVIFRVEVLVYGVYLASQVMALEVGVTQLKEADPHLHDDDLRIRPFSMDALNETLVVFHIVCRIDIVCLVGVVSANVYDDDVGSRMRVKVPSGRLVAPNLLRPPIP